MAPPNHPSPPSPPPTPPPGLGLPWAPTQAGVGAMVAATLASPTQAPPAWVPAGVAALIRACLAADEEALRARAVRQMEAESAALPFGSPVATPDYFRRDAAHPDRPAAWIRDWDTGAVRPRILLDDLWEVPTELEFDESDAAEQSSQDDAEEQSGEEEGQADAKEQRG